MSKKRGIYRVVYRETSSRLGHGYGYIRIIHGWIIWVSIQMDSAGYANRIKRHLDFFCMCYPGVSGYSTIQRYIPGWISSSQGPGYYPDYPVPKSGFGVKQPNRTDLCPPTVGTEMSFRLGATVNLLGCIIISFVYGWKLSLVGIFTIMPVSLTVRFLQDQVESGVWGSQCRGVCGERPVCY